MKDDKAETDSAQANPSRRDQLNTIFRRLNEKKAFVELMPELESQMLEYLHAERMTVYQKGQNDREIVSRYKSMDETIHEIRLPLTPTSIAGYVAMSQKGVNIADVYDAKQLAALHPQLTFDRSFDQRSGFRTRAMIAAPIKCGGVMLGVLQIINHVRGSAFSKDDFHHGQELARVLGHKFRVELQGTRGPFDLLVQSGKASYEKVEAIKRQADQEKVTVSSLLMRELSIGPEVVGESFARYYQVPYRGYDPQVTPPDELMQGLNPGYLEKRLWLPIAGDRKRAVILIDDPSDAARIMEIQRRLPADSYEFCVGLPEDILRYLGKDPLEETADEPVSNITPDHPGVAQLVNQLLVDAYKAGAMDLIIENAGGTRPGNAKFRVDGVLRDAMTMPVSHAAAAIGRFKMVAKLDANDSSRPQTGSCQIKMGGRPVGLRIATTPTVEGEMVTVRILVPKTQRV